MGKRIKKLLSVLLAAAMLLTAAPIAGSALSESENLIYKISDGEVTITYYTPSLSGELTIPSTIEGYPVTSIGDGAFYNCIKLTNVTIPYGVTSIGRNAFKHCEGLKKIKISDSVAEIDSMAFEGCIGLENVEIPGSVKKIRYCTFNNCTNLNSLVLNNGIEAIDQWAFAGCTNLKSISIPDSVTSIVVAFRDCSDVTEISVSKGNKTYDSREGCNAIIETKTNTIIQGCKNTTIPDSVTSIGYEAFWGCTGLTSITIPNSVTSIDGWAFYCSGLTGITIPDSVTSIGDRVFSGCKSLTSVKIGKSVTEIGEFAFNNCIGLKSINVDENNNVYDSRENCNSIIETETNTLIQGCKNTHIPDSVTSIGDSAFYNCTSLTSITIPVSLRNIGSDAFYGCTGLININVDSNNAVYDSRDNSNAIIETETNTLIQGCKNTTIPDSVTSIGYEAFGGCTGLISITIPNSVTNIGDCAFYGCTGLTNISISDSVKSIGGDVFYGCTKLKRVTIPKSVTNIGEWAFGYFTKDYTIEKIPDFKIYCYSGSAGEQYAIANGFDYEIIDASDLSYFDYEINDGEVTITDCDEAIIGELTIPSTIEGYPVTSIGSWAFEYCTGLTSVTIPDSVTNIGDCAFFGCNGLTSITIPDSVTSISREAFYKCTGLTSITIPDSVTNIGDCAFFGCNGLTSITIPDSVTSIGDDAFFGCTGLTNITIPKSVVSIDESAFGYYYDSDLVTQKVPNFKIYCYSGTAGVRYAITNGFDYEILSDTHTHTPVLVTVPATCTVDGMKYYICDECGETVGTPEVIKANGHSFDDWVVTLEPTTEKEGLKTRTCTLCGAEETQKIEKLKKLVDDKTGIEIVYNDQFENDVKVEVTQVFDGQSIQLINTEFGEVNTAIYDITTTQDGVKVQPSGAVTVRVPVPDDFKGGNIFACYVDSVNGTVTKIPATVVDGYVEFTVEHFSEYALVYGKGTVKSVSVDNIEMNYKKTATLNTVIGVDEGVNYTVEYSSSNPSVAKVDENGNVYGAKKGSAEITVTVTDEYGNTVSDTCNLKVNYSFGQWLIVILLFGWIWY